MENGVADLYGVCMYVLVCSDLPDSDKTQKFDVMFTTHDDQCTQSVKDYLTAQTADKTGLAETLNQLTHSSVLVNDAAIDTLTTHVAKGMDFNTAIKSECGGQPWPAERRRTDADCLSVCVCLVQTCCRTPWARASCR